LVFVNGRTPLASIKNENKEVKEFLTYSARTYSARNENHLKLKKEFIDMYLTISLAGARRPFLELLEAFFDVAVALPVVVGDRAEGRWHSSLSARSSDSLSLTE